MGVEVNLAEPAPRAELGPRPAPVQGAARRSSSLRLFARLTAGAAFFLLIAGGLVTSTGSGLAVPDWPLSYGQYFPAMVGGVFFEHGHRMAAGTVGLLTLALSVWIWVVERRPWVRRLAAAALGGIALQALLGGVTVLWGLPPVVSIAHACLGQTVFCLLLLIAESCSDAEDRSEPRAPRGFWRLGAFAFAALFLQLFLGAVLRHTGSGLVLHLLGAGLASAAAAYLCYRVFGSASAGTGLSRPAALLAVLVPVQLVLGLAAFAAKSAAKAGALRVALPTAHVACGALLLGLLAVWTLRAVRLEAAE